jgi:EAL and modified HD-GYP domain-containing signal transduction protein
MIGILRWHGFARRKAWFGKCHERKIPVLAEKVETDEQSQRCLGIGYDYFQGHFFCRPLIVGRRSVPGNKAIYLQLLQAANEQQFDLTR